MRLADVLNLPKEANSLAIIKDYLETSLTNLEYQAAFNFYLEIADALDLFDYVYTEGKRVFEQIENQTQTMYYEKILGHLIHACLALEHLDEAKKYIDIRKNALPVVNQYLGLLDEINLKKALHEPYQEELLRVIADVVPDHVMIYCHEELFSLYVDENNYDKALNEIEILYGYDLTYKYFHLELELLVKLERYEEAKKKALNALKKDKRDIEVVYVLLQIYYLSEDYVRASNLEAEYEEYFEAEDEEVRKKIYVLLIDLYKKMDHKPSINLYQSRLKNINKTISRKASKDDKKEETEQKVIFIEKPETKKALVSSEFTKRLDIAVHLIEYAHLMDEKLPLRDFLRLFFIEMDRYITTKEVAVYLNTAIDNFFFYKKERLYDKTIGKKDIEQTYIDDVLKGSEVFEQTAQMKWQKNIITGKDYDESVGFVYALPIGDEGVFVIHLEEAIEDPALHYDLLKLISSILFAKLKDQEQRNKLVNENNFYNKVINSAILCYREMTETRSMFNDEAMALFGIDKHHHFELFLRDISYEYVNQYKAIVRKLFAKPGEVASVLYTYQEKHILEKLYSIKYKDEVVIVSLFVDQTKEVNEAKSLVLQATVDPDTDLANRYAFDQAFKGYLDEKVSFCLLEFNDDLKHIYGIEPISKFFKEFAQVTKKHFQEGTTYRFDFNQLMVVLPFNDIRSVTKTVKQYFRMLEKYQSKVLTYESFQTAMGVLRYPVVTVERNREKLLRFFDIALEKAKRNKEEHVAYFVFRDYEDELFEQQVIDYLNQAIENEDIGLVFNQMIDMKNNVIWQYESELILTNLVIDARYLLKIAEKRNRLVALERFHIKQVCEFLVSLEKATERLIKITIPISKETFIDPSFNPFILGTLKQYGIPFDFIRLKCNMDLKINQYRNQVKELVDHGIGMDTNSVETAVFYPFHGLHIDFVKEDLRFGEYIRQLQNLADGYQMALVVRHVKTKEDKEWLARLGVRYIEGKLYKALPAPVLFNKIKDAL